MKEQLEQVKKDLTALRFNAETRNYLPAQIYQKLDVIINYIAECLYYAKPLNNVTATSTEFTVPAGELSFLKDKIAVGALNEYNPITSEANKLVFSDRNADYGHPADDFIRTAAMWSALLGIKIEPRFVPMFMICVKLSREINKPKRDNCVDIAGYAETLEGMKHELEKRK